MKLFTVTVNCKLGVMVANAFGVSGSGKRHYFALFPPSVYNPPSPSPGPPPSVITQGATFNLTKGWRVVETYDQTTKNAYLDLQCYDTSTAQWNSTQYFNSTL